MLPKLVGAVAVGLALASLAVPATAGQVEKVHTTVETWGADSSDLPPGRAAHLRGNGEGRVYGKVFADKPKCATLRKFSIFDQRDGADFRLGTGYSDSLGYWSINAHTADITGEVYAIAPKAKRGKRTVCKADRSPAIQVAFRASSAGGQRIPTTVLMEEVTSEGDGDDLIEGAVVSPRRRCWLGRRVDIFEQAVKGPPIKRGTAFADSNEHLTLRGQIFITETGRIFGKAAKLKLPNGRVCEADRSNILEVEF